jgi:nitrate reductase NapAB chaperone NapD
MTSDTKTLLNTIHHASATIPQMEIANYDGGKLVIGLLGSVAW